MLKSKQTQHWDTIARRYVEGADPTPQETFGPLAWLEDDLAMPATIGADMGEAAGDRTAYFYPPDAGLRTPVRGFDETFSGESVVLDHFFPENDNEPPADNRNKPGSHYRNPRSLNFYDWPAADDNRGPYITTYRGRFYPFDPRASEVNIYDIAHSLARICRYTGHGEETYCVAEHSVHIARWLLPRYGRRVALAGLLHDAPEALSGFGDVARPAKKRAPIIKQTENNIWRAVAAAFGLSPLLPDEVHEADSRIIADEMGANMHECDPAYDNPLGVTLEFWAPAEAEREFLAMYRELIEERKVAA